MKPIVQKGILAVCAVAALLGFFAYSEAGGAPGTANDPAVTLSYIEKVFVPAIMNTLEKKAAAAFGAKAELYGGSLEAMYNRGLAAVDRDSAADGASDRVIALLEKQNKLYRTAYKPVNLTLKLGDTLVCKAGTSIIVHSGQMKVQPAGKIGSLTLGQELSGGKTIWPKVTLLVYEDGAGMWANLDSGLTITGSYRIISYLPKYNDLAGALKAMGLFNGTTRGFELNRPATRLEALVMMIRLLGEEQAALAFTGACPFKDVPDWGKRYAAYAYSKQYTKGVSASLFDPDSSATPEQYITFLLRALGYNDNDFKWDESPAFAVQKGIYSGNEAAMRPFYRDQVVYLSYYALYADVKNGGSLLEKLISSGAVDRAAADAAARAVVRIRG